MAGFNPFSSITSGLSGGGGIMTTITAVVVGLGSLALIAAIIWFFWNKSRYNLKVEFKLPRSVKYLKEGDTLNPNDVSGFVDWEWGKASYNSKTGVVWLKRPRKKAIAMKPFQLSRYLQGKNLLTVVQVGATEYIPVMPESFVLYEDEKGEAATLLKLRADTSESRAWKNSFERESKNAFSIASLLQQYAPIIAIGLVIVLWGVQFIMVKKGMCGG